MSTMKLRAALVALALSATAAGATGASALPFPFHPPFHPPFGGGFHPHPPFCPSWGCGGYPGHWGGGFHHGGYWGSGYGFGGGYVGVPVYAEPSDECVIKKSINPYGEVVIHKICYGA